MPSSKKKKRAMTAAPKNEPDEHHLARMEQMAEIAQVYSLAY